MLDIKNLGFKIKSNGGENELWDIVCFGDNDYAGDPNTRRSFSQFILYIFGVPVSLRSKAVRSITLLSLEVEWGDYLKL